MTTDTKKRPSDDAALELAPVLAARELWQLLSFAFSDPFHRDRWRSLSDAGLRQRVEAAARLLAAERSSDEPIAPAEVDPTELPASAAALFAAFDEADGDLEVPYRAVFGLTISPACPPCELEYESSHEASFRAQRMADIGGFYRAFGVRPAREGDERCDHVSTEVEFLSLLCAREAVARDAGETEVAETCAGARGTFFHEHGWWMPAFASLLHANSDSPFFQAAARLLAALVCAERRAHGLPPAEGVPRPNPVPAEDDAGCSTCPMSGGA